MKSKIAVTIGDLYGIGPEVVVKALRHFDDERLEDLIVIGSKVLLDQLGLDKKVDVIDPYPLLEVNQQDNYRAEYAKAALSYIDKAIELARLGDIVAIVTAPVNKKQINKYHPFIGHTEYFMEAFSVERVEMIFASSEMNLILTTRHIPLSKVASQITYDRLKEVIITANEFRLAVGDDRPIGVCGLNPHAGEEGLLGLEEKQIFIPVIGELSSKGIPVKGPFPADTIFLKRDNFSIIVANYHDQGLAVLKTLSMKTAVNITWGLPIVRTSVSHGTAFDIRGKFIADESSMYWAIKWAVKLGCNREECQ